MDSEDRLHTEFRRSHRTMMNPLKFRLFAAAVFAFLSLSPVRPSLHAQTPAANLAQQLAFSGLRSLAAPGQINGVKSDRAGNLYLLLDQRDGLRLLETDNAASRVLAQARLGAKGDVGLALDLDPAGNVYVTGTTTSGTLASTPGAAIPNPTDGSTQSFVAKFDPSLNPLFVTFTGGSRIAAQALSATADAVFVTGLLYAPNLPVTADGIQQQPAPGSVQNGFVEKFSASGSTLLYATYLTGAGGDTSPTGIVADASDNAYIVGSTSAPGFPTVAALVPSALSSPSGFLTRLSPAGDAIAFSTLIPGPGLSSIALDSSGQALLVSGSVALGQFPVQTVTNPILPAPYQTLLRLPLDGSAVLTSVLLAPGTRSVVAAAPGGAAWLDGVLPDGIGSASLLPLSPLAEIGQGYALRVTAAGVVDQTARFGGVATSNPTYASLPINLTALAVDPAGEAIVAGSIQPTASSSLLGSVAYDLPLRNAPTPALPSTLKDARQTAATCSGSLCAGSAAYLAKLTPLSAPALALSADDLPFVTLRNLGTAQADNLQLTTTAGSLNTDCPPALLPGAQCHALLAGGQAGTLTAASSNTQAQSVDFAAYLTPPSTVVFSPRALDFGVQTAGSAPGTRSVTVTNLGPASETFLSANASLNPSPFTETATDCTLAGGSGLNQLGPGGTCHITLSLTASPSPANDGFQQATGPSQRARSCSPATPRPPPSVPRPRRSTSARSSPAVCACRASSFSPTARTPLSPTPRSLCPPPRPSRSTMPAPPACCPPRSAGFASTTSPPRHPPPIPSHSRSGAASASCSPGRPCPPDPPPARPSTPA